MDQQNGTARDIAIDQSVTSSKSAGPAAAARSSRGIFLFWAPLALQWIMMAVEGPFLAAIIARMAEPAYNLAAYGIALAFAILLESPVIMLMSASTALVEDSESYRRLRNFANALNIGATALVFVVLIPSLFHGVTDNVLGLPDEVRSLVYGALWLLLPWPAAIGYRRFLHGILIRSGRTRLVAYGTLLRLGGMGVTGFLLYFFTTLPGAWVGALALSAGVTIEAIAARFMATEAVAKLRATPPRRAPARAVAEEVQIAWAEAATVEPADEAADEMEEELTGARYILARGEEALRRTGAAARTLRKVTIAGYGDIARFYFPLALTSLIGLTVHPLLTFFMGRAPAPLESLAIFPVVHALSFLFRAPGLAFQEVVIALSGRRLERIGPLATFGIGLGLIATLGLALVTFTPLAVFWFETVSGLSPELAALAIVPARIMVLLPAMTVLQAFQQAVLVQTRRTRSITVASLFEVSGIAVLFVLLGWQVGLFGASAAMVAFVGGRLLANGYLWTRVRDVLGTARATG
jgi:Na+-driven multidrug efflux pump